MHRRRFIIAGCVVVMLAWAALSALVNTALSDFFLAGSQPNQSGTFGAGCSCHRSYNQAVEPDFNWRGSMMAQSARDPLFYAALAIANQDAAFAGDLCLRCHTPVGWLEGRSVPTDGSALIAKDREGVQCEFCHQMVKPTPLGVNPYPDSTLYVTRGTYARDQAYLATLAAIPPTSGDGMYVVDSDDARRGPRNINPPHTFRYSPFHRDAAFCGTCHDVSNPVFDKQVDGSGNYYYTLNALNTPPPTFNPYDHFPVERTYSEWLMSAYNTPQGVYAPQFGGNRQYVSTCQHCHMRAVTGKAAQQGSAPVYNDLAFHDMTGGNTWIPDIINTFFPGETNAAALAAGKQRALTLLQNAATLQVTQNPPHVTVRVINQTGHKLPSGYPEGRRMWINLKAYDAAMNLVAEFGAYDTVTATLTTSNTKVYETKLGMSPEILAATGLSNDPDGSSFHFVLNNIIVKDNRIPPRGFTNANFKLIQAEPVGATYADGQFWDETTFTLPAEAIWYRVNLYYQTASKEYVEFLRDNNTTNNWGINLYNAWATSGKSRPVLMATYFSEEPLPVQLATFDATVLENGTVLLEWTTISEVNNYGFYVERRLEGQPTFATLPSSFVPGVGTTLDPQYYSWIDESVAPGSYDYRLRQVDLDGSQSYSFVVSVLVQPTLTEDDDLVKHGFALHQNYPNPFNAVTKIPFTLGVGGLATLSVYDVQGRQVAMLVNGEMTAGTHEVTFDASMQPTGVYIYKIQSGSFSQVRKMIVIR